MKKTMALCLAAVLALGLLAGCGSENGGKPSGSEPGADLSELPVSSSTGNPTFAEGLCIFGSGGKAASGAEGYGPLDKAGVPYSHVSAADLTDKEAQTIVEVLIPRQFDVFYLFQLDYHKIDDTQTIPISQWYALCTDERFTCVQDIRDFILRVYTGEQAQRIFRACLDPVGVPEKDEIYPSYRDYEGKLYRCTAAEGKGLIHCIYYADTTRIVGRTENTVSVEMYGALPDYIDDNDDYDEIYTFLLCRTPDGWRLDSNFLDARFL